jgi:hypothetical protein
MALIFLLEFCDGDAGAVVAVRNGGRGRRISLRSGWAGRVERPAGRRRRPAVRQCGQAVAGNRDHVGSKGDFHLRAVACGIDETEVGENIYAPAQLNDQRGQLRVAFVGELPSLQRPISSPVSLRLSVKVLESRIGAGSCRLWLEL